MHTYKTGEFAKLIGVTTKTLQRWDKSGVLKAHRTPMNRRFYTEEDYEKIMQERGDVNGRKN